MVLVQNEDSLSSSRVCRMHQISAMWPSTEFVCDPDPCLQPGVPAFGLVLTHPCSATQFMVYSSSHCFLAVVALAVPFER